MFFSLAMVIPSLGCGETPDPEDGAVPVISVSLNTSHLKMNKGETKMLSAVINPSNATNKNVTWWSTKETIVRVSNGEVCAISPGTTYVRVTTKDGNHSATCSVTVLEDNEPSVPDVPTTWVVSFNSNGGTSVSYQTVENGKTATMPTAPTRAADAENTYTFAGWQLNGVDYNFSTPVTGNITLTAKWTATPIVPVDPDPDQPGEGGDEEPTTYTITFNSNGGTPVTAQTVVEGERATMPTAPTRTADAENTYTFAGWQLNGVDYNFSTPVTGNITLTAKWTATPIVPVDPDPDQPGEGGDEEPTTYTITFNSTGGTAVAAQTVVEGEKAVEPTAPTKASDASYDYTFAGWMYKGELYDFDTAVTSDVLLVAKWNKSAVAVKYTVTFSSNGGTTVADQEIVEGQKVTKPANPTKESDGQYTYTFDYWMKGGVAYDFNTAVTENFTLIAKWTATPIGGGEGGGNSGETDDSSYDERSLTPQQYAFANVVSEDNYGRKVTVRDPSNPNNKYVGIWYSAWLGTHMEAGLHGDGQNIYDVNVLEQTNPSALNNPHYAHNYFHFASEPLYGYYSMKDPWIINRHVELLTMAGLDYLMIDATNAITTYGQVYTTLFQTLKKYYDQGWNVPKVAFYTNSASRETLESIQRIIYLAHPEWSDLWLRFSGDDRPVAVGVSLWNAAFKGGGGSDWTNRDEAVEPGSDLYNYFNFYESEWPSTGTSADNSDAMPWMAKWNRAPYPTGAGNIAASVIQHSSSSVYASNKDNNASRGFYGWENGGGKNSDWAKGDNLEWQINSARTYLNNGQARNLLITGWNEWMAIKNPAGSPSYVNENTARDSGIWFCDVYNAEYSRDIEMGKAYGDGFYLQLARHTREIKYASGRTYDMEQYTINDLSNLSIWEGIFTEYADFVGDAMERDGMNAIGKEHVYVDNTNRNDIASIKIVEDASNIYIYVETKENITTHTAGDLGWMNLMISTPNSGNRFMGYDYIINRKPNSAAGTTSIEKCTTSGTYAWSDAGSAEYYTEGKAIVFKIPLSTLGMSSSNISFNFKVTDNVSNPSDMMSYYIYGDSAPIGRLGYAYNKASY